MRRTALSIGCLFTILIVMVNLLQQRDLLIIAQRAAFTMLGVTLVCLLAMRMVGRVMISPPQPPNPKTPASGKPR